MAIMRAVLTKGKSLMIIDNLPVGKDVPNSVNVIIEIPAQASPVKYEVDKETG
ncbi:MAG: hypothetical protein RLZZ422_2626, partial [Pseudomonadota bacterium]